MSQKSEPHRRPLTFTVITTTKKKIPTPIKPDTVSQVKRKLRDGNLKQERWNGGRADLRGDAEIRFHTTWFWTKGVVSAVTPDMYLPSECREKKLPLGFELRPRAPGGV